MGFRSWGFEVSGFEVWCLRSGFGDQDFRVQGSGFRMQGYGFRVQGSGSRLQGARCRVRGVTSRCSSRHSRTSLCPGNARNGSAVWVLG